MYLFKSYYHDFVRVCRSCKHFNFKAERVISPQAVCRFLERIKKKQVNLHSYNENPDEPPRHGGQLHTHTHTQAHTSAAASRAKESREQRAQRWRCIESAAKKQKQVEKLLQLVAQRRVALTHAQAHVLPKKLMQLLFVASENFHWLGQN